MEEGIRKRHVILFAMLLLFSGAAGRADDTQPTKDVQPPFPGMRWGEPSVAIEKLLKGARANIVEKRKNDSGDVWTVEGLVQASLRRTLFYFKDEMLVEVELQYQNADWDDAKYNDFMGQVRQRIAARYGEGQLIARSKSPQDGNVMQTIVGYKWSLTNTAIQLFYFSAENSTEIYRTISIHYKAY